MSKEHEAHEALGAEKPDVKKAHGILINIITVLKGILPSYQGVEPIYSRLIGFTMQFNALALNLEKHLGIAGVPLPQLRESINPKGDLMSTWITAIKEGL